MKKVKLIYTSDNSGNDGFVLANLLPALSQYEFFTANGRGIAHDVIEHIHPNNDMNKENEIYALGASIFVRYHQDYQTDFDRFRYHYTPARVIVARDVARIMADIYDSGDSIHLPDYCPKHRANDCFDELWQDIAPELRQCFMQEFRDREGVAEFERDMEQAYQNAFDDMLPIVRRIMHEGYVKARRKYKDHDLAHYIFSRIAETVESIRGEYDGQEFMLSVDMQCGDCTI